VDTNPKQELGERLTKIARETKKLKRKRGRIKKRYVPRVKNPLIGYEFLWGTRALRSLPLHKEAWRDHYRDLFFEDIKFKSKLSRIKKRIDSFNDEYQSTLAQIKV
jgi:hypothetical protein